MNKDILQDYLPVAGKSCLFQGKLPQHFQFTRNRCVQVLWRSPVRNEAIRSNDHSQNSIPFHHLINMPSVIVVEHYVEMKHDNISQAEKAYQQHSGEIYNAFQ